MLQQCLAVCWALLFRVLQCQHKRAQAVVGKTYCPDCGQGVVYEWWLLRCTGCQRYRKASWVVGMPWLEQYFCIECGHHACRIERYTEPPLYHLDHVLIYSKTVPQALWVTKTESHLAEKAISGFLVSQEQPF